MTSLEQSVLGDELMTAIAALRRLVHRRLRSAVPGLPLRGAHIELLQVVKKQPGIGIASAGRALHLAANSVSTLVNQLIDLGMLARETAPGDRRAAQLWLTEAATQRLAEYRRPASMSSQLAWRGFRAPIVKLSPERCLRCARC